MSSTQVASAANIFTAAHPLNPVTSQEAVGDAGDLVWPAVNAVGIGATSTTSFGPTRRALSDSELSRVVHANAVVTATSSAKGCLCLLCQCCVQA